MPYLAKYNPAGIPQWRKDFAGACAFQINGMSVDANGNAYLGGYRSGDLDGDYDAFLMKVDALGTLLWDEEVGNPGFNGDYVNGVAVGPSGNVFVAGFTTGAIGGPNQGGLDAFIGKYDPSGNLVWSRQLGTTEEERGYAITVDRGGNPIMVGFTAGTLDGSGFGGNDGFIAKYGP
jgi:outer membrane protein assembly factor BamB